MKMWLFLFVYMGCLIANAQNIYVPGKIAQGETAAYRCKVLGGGILETANEILEVSNVNNVEMAGLEGWNTFVGNHEDAFLCVLRESLTTEEWNSIKGKKGYGLTLRFIVGKNGEVQDLFFMFWNTDPVFSKFVPDRLYELEQKFKEALKKVLGNFEKPLRSIVYLQGLDFRSL